jgi:hypothetical protein
MESAAALQRMCLQPRSTAELERSTAELKSAIGGTDRWQNHGSTIESHRRVTLAVHR